MSSNNHFDMVVIGSGPVGLKAAFQGGVVAPTLVGIHPRLKVGQDRVGQHESQPNQHEKVYGNFAHACSLTHANP